MNLIILQIIRLCRWRPIRGISLGLLALALAGCDDSADRMAMRNSRAPVVRAAVRVSPAALDAAAADMRLTLDEAATMILQARARTDELSTLPDWPRVAQLEKRLADIAQWQAAGDMACAYESAASWDFKRMREDLRCTVLEAIPVLVAGPFGRPGHTDLQAQDRPVANYADMDEPFLSEAAPDPRYLTAGFKPDLTRKYTGFEGREALWQKGVIAPYLSLMPWAPKGPWWCVVYIYFEFYCPAPRKGRVLVALPHSTYRLWLNGGLTTAPNVRLNPGRELPVSAQHDPPVNGGNLEFKQGWNTVLIKFYAREKSAVGLRLGKGWTNDEGRGLLPMGDVRYRAGR